MCRGSSGSRTRGYFCRHPHRGNNPLYRGCSPLPPGLLPPTLVLTLLLPPPQYPQYQCWETMTSHCLRCFGFPQCRLAGTPKGPFTCHWVPPMSSLSLPPGIEGTTMATPQFHWGSLNNQEAIERSPSSLLYCLVLLPYSTGSG